MYDAIVIGSGPAGISASIYIKRAGLHVLIISKGMGALGKTEAIENYYGFENIISGKELHEKGKKQAKRLGVSFVSKEVIAIKWMEQGYEVITENQAENEKYLTKTVIIATGSARNISTIKGIKEFEGKGVSYCAVCDAFFYRNKKVAVLGNGNYAIGEAMELLPVAESVTLLTNGDTAVENRSDDIQVNEKKIREFRGDSKIEEVAFEDDTKEEISGVFIALGTASSVDFARKLGAKIENNKMIVNEQMQTTVPGVYACGDCAGGLLQISKAVYEGTKAGLDAISYIRSKK